MKTNLFLISVLALILCACQNPSSEDVPDLAKIVADVNKKCPQMVDSETRFDGMEFKEPNTLSYKYTLINVNSLNVDTADFRKALWPGILATIRVSPEMQPLRDSKTTFLYEYWDKAHMPIYVFTIRPDHYR